MVVKPSDAIVAGVPMVASMTLSQINSLVGIIGGILGIAYLLWKWYRDAKAKGP